MRNSQPLWSEATETNEKAVRQLDGLFFQGRIVPTEVQKDHQNFLAKSYWAAKASVKEFLQNKCLCFQQFNYFINTCPQVTENVTLWRFGGLTKAFSVS
jgi:hypothetical protein